jgi:hypothetical protein
VRARRLTAKEEQLAWPARNRAARNLMGKRQRRCLVADVIRLVNVFRNRWSNNCKCLLHVQPPELKTFYSSSGSRRKAITISGLSLEFLTDANQPTIHMAISSAHPKSLEIFVTAIVILMSETFSRFIEAAKLRSNPFILSRSEEKSSISAIVIYDKEN